MQLSRMARSERARGGVSGDAKWIRHHKTFVRAVVSRVQQGHSADVPTSPLLPTYLAYSAVLA